MSAAPRPEPCLGPPGSAGKPAWARPPPGCALDPSSCLNPAPPPPSCSLLVLGAMGRGLPAGRGELRGRGRDGDGAGGQKGPKLHQQDAGGCAGDVPSAGGVQRSWHPWGQHLCQPGHSESLVHRGGSRRRQCLKSWGHVPGFCGSPAAGQGVSGQHQLAAAPSTPLCCGVGTGSPPWGTGEGSAAWGGAARALLQLSLSGVAAELRGGSARAPCSGAPPGDSEGHP